MRAIILHLQVPENFVEICMKEWDGDKPISKIRIAELFNQFIQEAIDYHSQYRKDYEEFIKEHISLVTNKPI